MDKKPVTTKIYLSTRNDLRLLAALMEVSMQEAARIAITEKLKSVKEDEK